MAKRPTVSSISRARAEADFATWSMMAKLGSVGGLPPDAQKYLADYQERLKTMSEQAAVAATVSDMDAAYQEQMKRTGQRLDPQDAELDETAEVVSLEEAQRIRAARQAATRQPAASGKPRPLPVWLIFAGLVMLVVACRYFSGGFRG